MQQDATLSPQCPRDHGNFRKRISINRKYLSLCKENFRSSVSVVVGKAKDQRDCFQPCSWSWKPPFVWIKTANDNLFGVRCLASSVSNRMSFWNLKFSHNQSGKTERKSTSHLGWGILAAARVVVSWPLSWALNKCKLLVAETACAQGREGKEDPRRCNRWL